MKIRSVLAIFCKALICPMLFFAHPTFVLAEDNKDLYFLTPVFEEAQKNFSEILLAEQNLQSKEAQQGIYESEFLPSVALDASTGPSRSYRRKENVLLNPNDSATWGSKVGLSVRQNIYQAGISNLRISKSELDIQVAVLALQQAKAKLYTSVMLDLQKIFYLHARLRESLSLFDRAKDLEKIAQRKRSSGFLGARDLLETQRELFRAQSQVTDGNSELADAISQFNRKYKLSVNLLPAVDFKLDQRFLKMENDFLRVALNESKRIAGLLSDGTKDSSWKNSFLDPIYKKNIAVKIRSTNLKLASIDLDVNEKSQYRPSLDLVAGVDSTFLDNRNSLPSAAKNLPDNDINLYARLAFTLQLYTPLAAAQVHVAEQNVRQAVIQFSDFQAEFEESLLQELERFYSLQSKVRLQKELLKLSDDLRDKNVRLFEAGEADVLNVISSQQDLSAQVKQLLDIERQINTIALQFFAALNFGYFAPVGVAGAPQVSLP